MKLNLNKINNLGNFFNKIDSCSGPVRMDLPDGGSLDMKTGFGQFMFEDKIFNRGAVNEVTLYAENKKDEAFLAGQFGKGFRRPALGV